MDEAENWGEAHGEEEGQWPRGLVSPPPPPRARHTQPRAFPGPGTRPDSWPPHRALQTPTRRGTASPAVRSRAVLLSPRSRPRRRAPHVLLLLLLV